MAKFNQGDIVVLKSGGPKMTVEGYAKNDPSKLLCTWFDNNNERVSQQFREVTLKKYGE